MAQLIVRNLEDQIVRKLREMAASQEISMEEAHRRLLRKSLLGTVAAVPAFKDYLRAMPALPDGALFERKRKRSKRPVKL